MEEEVESLQVLQAEIEGFLWLGSIQLRGSVMNKGMEWDKVKSLGDIPPRRDSAEPRPRGCSGLGEPRPALPSF